jgi:hypothetical protein
MRWLVTTVGALAVLGGGVWMMQGMRVLPGSFMSGDPTWIWIGAATAAMGLGLVAWSRRRASGAP